MKEMERITGKIILCEESKKKWKEVALHVRAQSQLEKRNRGVCSALELCESIKGNFFLLINLVLMYMYLNRL